MLKKIDMKLQELHKTNNKLRDLLMELQLSNVSLVRYTDHLHEQIRRNLYYDPPPGITYGVHTRSVSTQTDFVPLKKCSN